ncbi:biotin-[acetyl-CoA-carboxylase] ligase [Paracoccidioides brasiliensis]|uniref:Biotin-[acetyl-CoA-carboxylase] ligase n=1 Tax=Paracoccidioides brasiliensis TaxID=121759 RepID=A0A1D2JHB1_PARBR|nr:biotin-[acetyl-CoA-carboxylase] ligase [Paracoccidioides brasiliensis]ODH50592.1 biotin-[acetyl-CoA-carboxylase] ligase [Paracoccidioides brasiliensis]
MTTTNPNLLSKKLNVLVYSGAQTYSDWKGNVLTPPAPGNGTTIDAVRHCLYSLRQLLAANYAVIPVTGDMIISEPWTASCALLVIPGGADLPYCRTLNGEGNRRICQFVQRGGAYLGLCAGGYYASKRCEFEVGNKKLEVIGERELAFYPGICRGCVFPGFVYDSENGARAAELKVSKSSLAFGSVSEIFRSYHNGGGVFVDAPKYADRGVAVLASYTEKLKVDSGEGAAAVVYCKVGEGAAILTGPHPEFVFPAKPVDSWELTKPRFAASNLDRNADGPGYGNVVDTLAADDQSRVNFLKACLTKLGLRVNQDSSTVPSLSRLHLSSVDPQGAVGLISKLRDIITVTDGKEYIKDDVDTFHLEEPSFMGMKEVAESLPKVTEEKNGQEGDPDRVVDYNSVIKEIVVHDDTPSSKATPSFNHHAFYANLKEYRAQSKDGIHEFGSNILYGEVVTSTNTLLEKNTQLLRRLPQGFVATATVQLAGRGRGSNVWVSPSGQLMFSTVIKHSVENMNRAPVVFIQYIAAIAIIQGIKRYDKGYENMPVKLKWPNDIYALDPTQPDNKSYTKVAGILVNAHYSSAQYIAVVGIGLNALNTSPTTSLNSLLSSQTSKNGNKPLPPLSLERLLASILTKFESLYIRFLRTGFDQHFLDMYYADWLHMDQIVTLEAEDAVRARIKGITSDYGLLVAEELGWEDQPTGKRWELQSDSNSFDFFRGLVKRKI